MNNEGTYFNAIRIDGLEEDKIREIIGLFRDKSGQPTLDRVLYMKMKLTAATTPLQKATGRMDSRPTLFSKVQEQRPVAPPLLT